YGRDPSSDCPSRAPKRRYPNYSTRKRSMRQRRQGLQVNTFPFLAVPLCAMGSLILLLLVIDRRARVVHRNTALKATEIAAAENEKAVSARRAEWERRRQILHEQLATEDQSVVTEVRAIRHRIEESASAMAAEHQKTDALMKEFEGQKSALAR